MQGAHFDGGGWRVDTQGVVKMGLRAVGGSAALRYLANVVIGTPPQVCVRALVCARARVCVLWCVRALVCAGSWVRALSCHVRA